MIKYLMCLLVSCNIYAVTNNLAEHGFSKVIGKDDRIKVNNTTSFPYRSIGMLRYKQGKTSYACTGTLIGPRHVLTAGHCIVSNGVWATNVVFIPGKNGSTEPYRQYKGEKVLTNEVYAKSRNINYDYGMVVLKEYAGEQVGTMIFDVYDRDFAKVNIAGYSGDKPFGTQWRSYCPVVKESNYLLMHTCDTNSGTSGAAAYTYNSKTHDRVIYGIHTGSYGQDNRATKINQEVFDQLNKWIDEN